MSASDAFFVQRKQKVMKDFTDERPKPVKRSRNHDPVVENVVHGASSHQSIEHPTMSENSSGYMNQAPSRELASQVQVAPSALQEGTSHQMAITEFRDAHEAFAIHEYTWEPCDIYGILRQNAQVDVDITDNFQTTYLESLRIFDAAIEKIAKVHPYAKMALGCAVCCFQGLCGFALSFISWSGSR
ncbi:uncharacterized protein EDB91DRAFT_892758 [Suillus paluster]|uniref:uncharacterized protein n=1 Tax=Suillus paluster TaxID=48578 RepID=UPI001B879648|nr:uncharacterized protein EDB91DRAFT_892758 [Suillus paluster]KAG1727384.1 hypothetical protein EDB91DRAFT_892758 [Suillus paluster]